MLDRIGKGGQTANEPLISDAIRQTLRQDRTGDGPATIAAETQPLPDASLPPVAEQFQPDNIESLSVSGIEERAEIADPETSGSSSDVRAALEGGDTIPWLSGEPDDGSVYGSLKGDAVSERDAGQLGRTAQSWADEERSDLTSAIGRLRQSGIDVHQDAESAILSLSQDRQPGAEGKVELLSQITDIPSFVAVATMVAAANGGSARDLANDFAAAGNYVVEMNKDFGQINELISKAMNSQASGEELQQLNQLLRPHSHNLNLIQTWLNAKCEQLRRDGSLSPMQEAKMEAVFSSLAGRLGEECKKIDNAIALCVECLPEHEPISRANIIQAHLIEARAALNAVKNLPQTTASKVPEKTMRNLIGELDRHCLGIEKLRQLEAGAKEAPRVDKALESQLRPAGLWGELKMDKPGKKASGAIKKALTERWGAINRGRSNERPLKYVAHPEITQTEYLSLFVNNQLKHARVPESAMPKMNVLIREGRAKALSELPESWQVIAKELKFQHNGKEQAVKSVITPSAHFLNDRLAEPSAKRGIASSDRLSETRHVPNLASTELSNAQGEKIFSGLRHGVLDAYGLSGKNLLALPEKQLQAILRDANSDENGALRKVSQGRSMTDLMADMKTGKRLASAVAKAVREHAANTMAKELIMAALIKNPDKCQAALQGQEVDIVLDSVSLVTPDPFRGLKSKKGEKDMLKIQTAALRNMRGKQQFKLRGPDGKEHAVAARVRINTVNFGVNGGAVGWGITRANPKSRAIRALTGWGFAAQMNDPALKALVGNVKDQTIGGEAGEKIRQLVERRNSLMRNRAAATGGAGIRQREIDGLNKEINILTDLATQVRALQKSRAFSQSGHEPYKMVSRLALLSNKLGHDTAFNCKSGKDRTGQLDAEVKYLAAVADASGHVPEPELKPTQESKKAKTIFALSAGNHEMQRYNTGMAGYKLAGVKALRKQMEEAAWPIYRGGSSYVQS